MPNPRNSGGILEGNIERISGEILEGVPGRICGGISEGIPGGIREKFLEESWMNPIGKLLQRTRTLILNPINCL